jgi:hypothetical protein
MRAACWHNFGSYPSKLSSIDKRRPLVTARDSQADMCTKFLRTLETSGLEVMGYTSMTSAFPSMLSGCPHSKVMRRSRVMLLSLELEKLFAFHYNTSRRASDTTSGTTCRKSDAKL